MFHFLTDAQDRKRYVQLAYQSLKDEGRLLLATFAEDGPTHCSGLEVCRYNELTLQKEWKQGFDILHFEKKVHFTPSGKSQSFLYSLFCKKESFSI